MALPAPKFFTLLKTINERKQEEFSLQFENLTRVAKVNWGGEKYADALEGFYANFRKTEKQLKKAQNPFYFDSEDKQQSDMAAFIILDAMKAKARVERGV